MIQSERQMVGEWKARGHMDSEQGSLFSERPPTRPMLEHCPGRADASSARVSGHGAASLRTRFTVNRARPISPGPPKWAASNGFFGWRRREASVCQRTRHNDRRNCLNARNSLVGLDWREPGVPFWNPAHIHARSAAQRRATRGPTPFRRSGGPTPKGRPRCPQYTGFAPASQAHRTRRERPGDLCEPLRLYHPSVPSRSLP